MCQLKPREPHPQSSTHSDSSGHMNQTVPYRRFSRGLFRLCPSLSPDPAHSALYRNLWHIFIVVPGVQLPEQQPSSPLKGRRKKKEEAIRLLQESPLCITCQGKEARVFERRWRARERRRRRRLLQWKRKERAREEAKGPSAAAASSC